MMSHGGALLELERQRYAFIQVYIVDTLLSAGRLQVRLIAMS